MPQGGSYTQITNAKAYFVHLMMHNLDCSYLMINLMAKSTEHELFGGGSKSISLPYSMFLILVFHFVSMTIDREEIQICDSTNPHHMSYFCDEQKKAYHRLVGLDQQRIYSANIPIDDRLEGYADLSGVTAPLGDGAFSSDITKLTDDPTVSTDANPSATLASRTQSRCHGIFYADIEGHL